MQLWIVAYLTELGGWCVVNMHTSEVLAGPYAEQLEAVAAAQSRAWRIAQGWKP